MNGAYRAIGYAAGRLGPAERLACLCYLFYLCCLCCLCCLSGCFLWEPDSDPKTVLPLEAKTRMEFIENRENRDSLIDVFVGVRVSNAVPGRAYHVSAGIEFNGKAGYKEFDEVHSSPDTVIAFSRVFTEEIGKMKGVTLRGRFMVDSVELARDSVTYH